MDSCENDRWGQLILKVNSMTILYILAILLTVILLFFIYNYIREQNARRKYFEHKKAEEQKKKKETQQKPKTDKIDNFASDLEALGYFKYVDSKKLKQYREIFKSNLSKNTIGVSPTYKFDNTTTKYIPVNDNSDFRSGPSIWEDVFYVNDPNSEENTYEVDSYKSIFINLTPLFKARNITPNIEFRTKTFLIEGEELNAFSTIISFIEGNHQPIELICWLINKILQNHKSEEKAVSIVFQEEDGEHILFLDKKLYFYIRDNAKKISSKISIDNDAW